MKADKTSRTAQYMALFRALENTRKPDDRLFTDPYAVNFIEPQLRFAVKVSAWPAARRYIERTIHQRIPGALSSGIARTRYIDDLLQQTVQQGIRQLLILGAGFDTRALRLDFLRNLPVIEVDHPNTFAHKMAVFRRQQAQLPANITFCQVDFNQQGINDPDTLKAVDLRLPTTVIWEGVTNYLHAEAVAATFTFIGKLPKGSFVIFTYIHQRVLDEPSAFLGGETLLSNLEQLQERWTFGLYPEAVADYLQQFGLRLLEDKGADEYRQQYLPARTEEGYEFYRVAIARRD
ncbi:class I SAM-dependent methyltransferase [Chitinophaga vietnamensis]|uniref:class I SAM-dependent methyltransferase n=1 Tax=Chitinophaga vietnamensis TaxID=2593957 RepID=UPI0011786768|nr:SAM-dependent methyltransferase [Chitinophaga vietnamensis]